MGQHAFIFLYSYFFFPSFTCPPSTPLTLLDEFLQTSGVYFCFLLVSGSFRVQQFKMILNSVWTPDKVQLCSVFFLSAILTKAIEHFHHLRKFPSCPFAVIPPWLQATTDLLSIIGSTFLEFHINGKYKYSLLCLAPFTYCVFFEIHSCCSFLL